MHGRAIIRNSCNGSIIEATHRLVVENDQCVGSYGLPYKKVSLIYVSLGQWGCVCGP